MTEPKKEERPVEKGGCTVWGLAAGRGSTVEAARGALTWRKYPDGRYDPRDWLRVICVEREDMEDEVQRDQRAAHL